MCDKRIRTISCLPLEGMFFFPPSFSQTNEGEIMQVCCGERVESKNFLLFQSILSALTSVFYWEGGTGVVIE